MNHFAPSGNRRGYIPPNTGEYRPASYPGPWQPGYYRQPPSNQNTGGMQYISSTGGGTRGFVMSGNTGSVPAGKHGKRKLSAAKICAITASFIVVVAAAVFGIKSIIDKNNYEQQQVKKPEQTANLSSNYHQYLEEKQKEVSKYDGLFLPGVYVDGIHLGGMTPEQALNSVMSQINQRNDDWYVDLAYNGNVFFTIKARMLNMSVDPNEELNKAWEPGHRGTTEERYQEMLRLQQEPYYGYTAKPAGDTTVIDGYLAEIKRQVDCPAVDATVSEFRPDQSEPFTFTDEIYGRNLNTEPLKEQLYRMVSTMENGRVDIIPDSVPPNVTRTELEHLYARRTIVYTPIDSHSSDNRNDNIRLAFSKINGYVLQPGKTFSFNKVVGKRTEKNEFKTAIEYVYGEHVEGIGGGVCQASTTLYQAAVCAGLEIKERHAHSDLVSYTDYGKDATVSDTKGHEKDLRFTNNTDYPIYIKAEVLTDTSRKKQKRLIAQVSLYGEDLGDVRYELTSELFQTLPPPYEPQYIKDKNREYVTYTDERKTVSQAQEGYIYNSYRVKYDGGTVVEKKLLDTDTYNPKPEKIYVGVTTRE